MSKNIQDVEGIGPKYAASLRQAGINTTDKLLEIGCDKNGRASLAEKISVNETSILKWVNMCDLFRIRGVAGQYAELLEAAGVDTVKELRTRNAENLVAKMLEVNKVRHLCKVTPGLKAVTSWIEQAKQLAPMLTY